MTYPILYSFRRCPYAMRARLAIASSGIQVELREIVLRDKTPEFLETSPTATVPCLKVGERVVDESLHIMAWALGQNDPENLMQMPTVGYSLMSTCDGTFKHALDRYKYPTRYPEIDPIVNRDAASSFIQELEQRLDGNLFGPDPKLADFAILPFIRQFAHVDLDWFSAQPWEKTVVWLQSFKDSARFAAIMDKYPKWVNGDAPTYFPYQD
ncbi:MAG: glutathione S-transferase [Rhodobacteraceae bacterium]|jgi:glutathione S-transferase|nr:glutathione S-transferase [Paracoccaceae bacterium]NCV11480.1 glutathione S-transferase [Paracoccaceae bacterium]NCW05551.1 glutathione S-transferase [Paracoccaceae bacterium]NCX21403.1 glutathione S-transferase [Paracoccaceae bacterium]NDD87619.1 glutathione S-transferase [Paracoccaceae bacterium]